MADKAANIRLGGERRVDKKIIHKLHVLQDFDRHKYKTTTSLAKELLDRAADRELELLSNNEQKGITQSARAG